MKRAWLTIVYIFATIGFVLVLVYVAVRFGFTNTRGIIDTQHDYFQKQLNDKSSEFSSSADLAWAEGQEWSVLEEAILKDGKMIDKAAAMAGVESRLIVAQLVVEQLRLYHSDREIFKSAFAPLKVLGNQNQFSWGVMGIKQDTARKIEGHLKDSSSPFYLGNKYEKTLDFETADTDRERFERLTGEENRYYSYLYAGLALNQLATQWKKAGFDISDRPEILSTLYNIGFQNSNPHGHPQVGGAEIIIGEREYSFGGLAGLFYYSDMLPQFPRK